MSFKIIAEPDDLSTDANSEKFAGYVDKPIKNMYRTIRVIDYRSLYPEPYEVILELYKLDIDILKKYSSKYQLIKKILNSKMNDDQFNLIKSEFIEIIKEIIDFEKFNISFE